jgi:hypothetical protein
MARANLIQTSFNGGELSPFVYGRPDVAKFASGCERMENFLPMIEGPAIARPGFRYVAEVKDSSDRAWLVRFEFSVEDSYILEFGDQYIRFYTNRGQVQVSGVAAWSNATAYTVGDLASRLGVNYYCKTAHTNQQPPNATYWHPLSGTIYEIPSPYAVAALTNSDGTFALRFAQTGDVVYLVHEDYAPRTLSRFGGTDWTLAATSFSPPPFAAENSTATTVYASAATGSVTLTASASIFTSAHVGQYFYIGEKDVRDVTQWEAAKSITSGDLRRSDGKNYSALNTATTGAVKPTHTIGAAYDGDTGVQWQFLDPGYGWVLITAYTSGTQVTATVVSRLPDGAVLVGNASARWAFQSWNAADGYPSNVTFFRERLVFSRKDTIWFSVTSDFTNFSVEIDGAVTADAAFERTLSSDRVNSIRWMSPGDVLLVGTLGDEWSVTEATTTDPFGPANCKTKRQSAYGSNMVAPMRVGSETLFVQKSGRKLRAMQFRFEEDGFQSPNVAAYARTVTGRGIVDMAFQQEPWTLVWLTRSDGLLIGLTFDREQDVVAWHRHPMTGAFVECVECIPAPDGSRDDLWIIAKYTIDGQTKRYIAYLSEEDNEDTEQKDWLYSDMCATYDGAPTTTIGGLDYLEGQEVWVLRDGARHPNRTVSGGEITLQLEGSVVQVGLPSEGVLETMNMDGGAASGSSQGKTKRAHLCTVRLYRSLGGVAGTSESVAKEIKYRSPTTPMGSAPPPFTGDVDVEWAGDLNSRMTFLVKKDRPMPLTVVALMPQVVVSEGR